MKALSLKECTEREQRARIVSRIIQNRFGPSEFKRNLSGIKSKELDHLSNFIRAADAGSTFSNISFHDNSLKSDLDKDFNQEIIRRLSDASLIHMVSIPSHYAESFESESDLDNIDLFSCHYALNIADDRLDKIVIWNALCDPTMHLFLKSYIAKSR
jgi:hypothetical protein